MKKFADWLLFEILFPPLLYSYERWLMYRIKRAWGVVHEYNIKNKGKNVRIVGYSRFLDPEKLKLGDNVRIGYGCFFYCKGGIEIGENSQISRWVVIYSGNHNFKGDAIPYNNEHILESVKIGNGVWIGMGVMIIPGVSIGDGAIIGMGTVVSKDVKAGEILVGAEQRVVAHRDIDRFYELQTANRTFSKLWPSN